MDGKVHHLSQMSTAWTMMQAAHHGDEATMAEARRLLIERYGAPVLRYLRAIAKDADAADEIYQEFALRLIRGDFRRAHPDKGRFRNFIKTTLFHLVMDHFRQLRRRPGDLSELCLLNQPAPSPSVADDFSCYWRDELLNRTWSALQQLEQETGQPLYTVLRLRASHPAMNSTKMAEQLASTLNKPIDAGWVRKRLYHARVKFAQHLTEEIAQSLEDPTATAIEEELLELGLLEYCRSGLKR